ncbi:MAG: hypothetical protein RSD01_03125, partial [Ruthenibacterium sp.]
KTPPYGIAFALQKLTPCGGVYSVHTAKKQRSNVSNSDAASLLSFLTVFLYKIRKLSYNLANEGNDEKEAVYEDERATGRTVCRQRNRL